MIDGSSPALGFQVTAYMARASRWADVCERLDCSVLAARFEALASAYSEKHRRYHTLVHVDECLGYVDRVRELIDRPDELELAIWLHDIVYSTRRSDNEERSADMAQLWLAEAGADRGCIARVRDLILATRHTASDGTGDAALIQDIDLNVLGAPPMRYDEYEDQIRQEYRWVPRPLFRRRRAELLRAFLARASIYNSDWFRKRLEARARSNLERALRRLSDA